MPCSSSFSIINGSSLNMSQGRYSDPPSHVRHLRVKEASELRLFK